jgi:hypothetical protein
MWPVSSRSMIATTHPRSGGKDRRCSARKAKSDPRKLLGHPRADPLQRRCRTDHHLELRDHSRVVEGELVDPFDILPVDNGRELENRNAIDGILELMDVAKPAADPKYSLGRLKNLRNLIPALIRLEQNRATERRVLAEELGRATEIPSFDSSPETVGEHPRSLTRRQKAEERQVTQQDWTNGRREDSPRCTETALAASIMAHRRLTNDASEPVSQGKG